jgi:hypothetical protein
MRVDCGVWRRLQACAANPCRLHLGCTDGGSAAAVANEGVRYTVAAMYRGEKYAIEPEGGGEILAFLSRAMRAVAAGASADAIFKPKRRRSWRVSCVNASRGARGVFLTRP